MRLQHVALVICAFITSLSFADAAHAVYHPTLGKWLSRDPDRYVDGTSLYEYVRSAPGVAVDPSGRYGIDVHFVDTLGACWRADTELCFRACVDIADATWGWDDPGKDAPTNAALCNLGVGLLLGCDKNYDVHFPGAGPPTLGGKQDPVVAGSANNSAVSGYINKALESCDVQDIGKALHSLQDSYSHKGTPDWFGGHPKGRDIIDPRTGQPAKSGGTLDQAVDDPASDPERYQKMKDDLQSVMNEIARKCWCKLCGPRS
jgi:hypothetical protein